MDQPHIPSFVRSLKRSRLRLISITAGRVNYTSPEATPRLLVPHSDVILGQTEPIFALFILSPFLNYALYISEVTIVTKASFILTVYVHAGMKRSLSSLFAFHLFASSKGRMNIN